MTADDQLLAYATQLGGRLRGFAGWEVADGNGLAFHKRFVQRVTPPKGRQSQPRWLAVVFRTTTQVAVDFIDRALGGGALTRSTLLTPAALPTSPWALGPGPRRRLFGRAGRATSGCSWWACPQPSAVL